MSLEPELAVTPHRRTRLRLGTARFALTNQAFALVRTGREVGRGPSENLTRVLYLEGLGWTLAPFQLWRNAFHELSATQSRVILPGSGAQAAGFLSVVPRSRPEADYAPMAGGYPSEFPASGTLGLLSRVGASHSIADQSLAADAAAFPGPTLSADRVPLDRVLVTTEMHEPDDAFHLTLFVPPAGRGGLLGRVYFSGPAGGGAGWTGTGRYCLELDEARGARLFEFGSAAAGNAWREVFSFDFREPNTRVYDLFVYTDARLGAAGWTGATIGFIVQSRGKGMVEVLLNTLRAAAMSSLGQTEGLHLYAVPTGEGSAPPVQLERLRVDLRRDVRAWFQLSRTAYPEIGILRDTPFVVGSFHAEPWIITHEFYGRTPVGTTLVAKLFDAKTGTELPVVEGPNPVGDSGWWQNHEVPAGAHELVAEYHFFGNGTETPLLEEVRFFTDAAIEAQSDPLDNPLDVSAVAILGTTNRFGSEAGILELNDPFGVVSSQLARKVRPFALETAYDPNDPNAVSVIAGGYAQAQGVRVGKRSRKFRVRLHPEAFGLDRPMHVATAAFGLDRDASSAGNPKAPKVTDIVRRILHDSGVPDEAIDLPESDVRFEEALENPKAFRAFRSVPRTLDNLAVLYLDSTIAVDFNARKENTPADVPLIRFLPIPHGPFRVLADFWSEAPPGSRRLVHGSGAFAPVEEDGQPVVQTFILQGTLSEPESVYPEFNQLVITSAPTSDQLRPEIRREVTVTNFRSAKFFEGQPVEPDPNSLDYLGSIRGTTIIDKNATTEGSLRRIARQSFDQLCRGFQRLSFDAPLLLVTDTQDPLQFRPRPLRPNDAVRVDGTEWLIESVDVDIDVARGGDRIQMATYHLRTLPHFEPPVFPESNL